MSSTELLVELFRLAGAPDLMPRYNIAPTQDAPIIRLAEGGAARRIGLLRWGLLPHWAKSPATAARMINARSETAADKPAFREAFRQRRCLVPADGFFEWKKDERGKQPYLIGNRDETPFAMAGLWEWWPGSPEHEDAIESFTILTTTPNDLVRPLHDRMPVILAPDDHERWLDPGLEDPEAIRALCRPHPAETMVARPVSRRVNSPANDDPGCIEPVEVVDDETGTDDGQRMLFS